MSNSKIEGARHLRQVWLRLFVTLLVAWTNAIGIQAHDTLGRNLQNGENKVSVRVASPDWHVIIAPVYANGRGPYWFIIDTGLSAASVEISHRLASKLGLRIGVSRVAPSFFGVQEEYAPTHLDSFQIGRKRDLPKTVAANSAVDESALRTHVLVSGYIGPDYFASSTLKLILDQSTMIIEKGGGLRDGSRFRFDRMLGLIVDVEIDGVPLKLVLDTGSPNTYITPVVAKRLGVREIPFTGKRLDEGRGYAELNSLELAGQRVKKVVAVVSRSAEQFASQSHGEVSGIVGYNVWSKFDLTIDFVTCRLLLVPRRT